MNKVIPIIVIIFIVFVAGIALYTFNPSVQQTVDTIGNGADNLLNKADTIISDASNRTSAVKATYEGFSPRTKNGLWVALLALVFGVAITVWQKVMAAIAWIPSSILIWYIYQDASYGIGLGIVWGVLFGAAALITAKNV